MPRQIAPLWGIPSSAQIDERVLRLEAQVALLAGAVERLSRLLEAHDDTTGESQ